jgi:hypothetical protein
LSKVAQRTCSTTKWLPAFATLLLQHGRGVRPEASGAVLCADGPTVPDVTMVNDDLCRTCHRYLRSAIPLWQPTQTTLSALVPSSSSSSSWQHNHYGWPQNGVQRAQFKTNYVVRWCPVTARKQLTMALRPSQDLPVLLHAVLLRVTRKGRRRLHHQKFHPL